jgi:uncharacterized membrane protein YtjA (UPF0391 family)
VYVVLGPKIVKEMTSPSARWSSASASTILGHIHPADWFTGGLMLRWAVVFFVVALIAAVFGFLGIAAAAVSIAKILFFVFLVLFLVSLVGGLLRRA